MSDNEKPSNSSQETASLNTAERKIYPKKVKPDLIDMPASPPESGIGRRIAYCRGQLDNLSVEALARYTKNFDTDGISRASIVRYEAGESLPGARELRILCASFWIPANWMLFGEEDFGVKISTEEKAYIVAMRNLISSKTSLSEFGVKIPSLTEQSVMLEEILEVQKRQSWLYLARNPPKN